MSIRDLLVRTRHRERWALLVVTLVIGAFSLPVGFSDLTNRYLDQALSLALHGTFDINRYHTNTRDKTLVRGNYYLTVPPLVGLAAVPATLIGHHLYQQLPVDLREGLAARIEASSKQAYRMEGSDVDAAEFLFLTNWVSALLMLPITFLWLVGLRSLLRHFSGGDERVPVVLLATLLVMGSHSVYYASRLASHVVMACALTWTLLLLARGQMSSSARAALAGLLCASLPLIEYQGAITALILGAFAVWSLRRLRLLVSFAAGAAPAALLFFAYHAALFGGPLTPGATTPFDPSERGVGFFGIESLGLAGYYRVIFDPEQGLLVFAPILIPAAIGVFAALREPRLRPVALCAGSVVLAQVSLIAALRWSDGGLSWGVRYLIPVVSVVGAGLAPIWRRGYGPAVVALGLIGMASNLAAVSQPFDHFDMSAPLPQLSLWTGIFSHGFYLPAFYFLQRLGGVNFEGPLGQSLILSCTAALLGVAAYFVLAQRAGANPSTSPPAVGREST